MGEGRLKLNIPDREYEGSVLRGVRRRRHVVIRSIRYGRWAAGRWLQALVFALAPLHRLAERMSSAGMPEVLDTPEYRQFRKLQIYGEAVTQTMRDGRTTTAVDRAVLNRFREQLALSAKDTASLESELIAEHKVVRDAARAV